MFGRVIYARRPCKVRALSVYLTHIIYALCPSTCVLLIEILATKNLYYIVACYHLGQLKWYQVAWNIVNANPVKLNPMKKLPPNWV